MTHHKVEKQIDEVRTWGVSLIVSGLLVIMLVLTSTSDWAEVGLILWIGIAMMYGGWCLYRYSDQTSHQISERNP
jgi:uncharacterized membrane protein